MEDRQTLVRIFEISSRALHFTRKLDRVIENNKFWGVCAPLFEQRGRRLFIFGRNEERGGLPFLEGKPDEVSREMRRIGKK